MAWSKGKPRGSKTGGRKAGTPNKNSMVFHEALEKHGLDPGEALINIYREQMKIYETYKKKNDSEGMLSSLSAAERTASNICQYVYPKKKAVEHKTEGGMTFASFMSIATNNSPTSS